MEGKEIIELFFKRDQGAVEKTAEVYGSYCTKIAMNILGSHEDSEECVNDAFLKAWEIIPPNRPEKLSAFLGKLTRNLAINMLKHRLAKKRGSLETDLILDELSEVISDNSSVELEQERKELMNEINGFLAKLPKQKRNIFILRYWYCDSVKAIAASCGISENNVSVTLNRVRKKLKQHLEKKGMI